MMNTPICDFIRRYTQSGAVRLHMPGHKGRGSLAPDITEIPGADSLYEAGSIIRESEENAGKLFGAHTLYSTEGSSQCIRAMLYLAVLHAAEQGRRPLIAAARNAHKAFWSAAALLDFDFLWLTPEQDGSYLSCSLTPAQLEKVFAEHSPTAVYLTSPDYLGNMLPLQELAQVCHRHKALLLVDNAHGAYLKFLQNSLHPMDLGADLCCDSAHKTLPVLTGGAYLHISKDAPELFHRQAKNALALFGSTSPSYLILQSLDQANKTLSEGYSSNLRNLILQLDALKRRLKEQGFRLWGNEPLKLTLAAKSMGYTGEELSGLLAQKGLVCEFSDPDFVVMMLSPELEENALSRLESELLALPQKPAIHEKPPAFHLPKKVMTPRQAMLCPGEKLPLSRCLGRVLASAPLSCPPAVPMVFGGEVIDEQALACLRYYGTDYCTVVKAL